jgi:hypothetical protein
VGESQSMKNIFNRSGTLLLEFLFALLLFAAFGAILIRFQVLCSNQVINIKRRWWVIQVAKEAIESEIHNIPFLPKLPHYANLFVKKEPLPSCKGGQWYTVNVLWEDTFGAERKFSLSTYCENKHEA